MSEQPANEPLFVDLHDNSKPAEIESLCMKCGENGTTRMLFTKIPHFKEIIIMAFECPHCGFRNNELQSAGAFNEKGHTVSCHVLGKQDLDRQLVKSDFASVKFEELQVEIPANNRRGLLTTVEGLVDHAVDDLSQGQPVRKHTDEDLYNKIQAVVDKLESYKEGAESFTLTIDDPSGNSYIENRCLPAQDPQLKMKWYNRTPEQNAFLGLQSEETNPTPAVPTATEGDEEVPEVLTFPANCSHCNAPSETNMHLIDIPHFKEVVIMATNCQQCGYKSNEVKAGGPISAKGKRITLKITDPEDLSRDILKSETCGLSIPEIDLEVTRGTLGGRFTTVEGLLRQVHQELYERVPFMHGDSTTAESRARWEKFLANLEEVADGKRIPVTLIIDDPLANSYLQNLYAPDDDPEMTIEEYERDWETNETLGLNDMNVDHYQATEPETKQ
ncbi:ZPR1 zinc-finger domain-containing protein [Radiomyces spectabilis]|uniref:ZPR1 zinc-finger domain-containing protein n=1 Tax=Radiomyces spectabilis TaxID=64574 RepID=UPI0022206D29|nr:ZPR1 zinc-finger domain-containing protein [Radiomyces spectabilis]KAI8379681.1 ZPR1 zinc-finger domain-containing protein [Radiomyces spectabilis]